MSEIKRKELDDVLHLLPQPKRVEEIEHLLDRPCNVFICALGFEDRCTSASSLLRDLGFRTDYSFWLEYETNKSHNDRNRASLEENLRAISSRVLTQLPVDEANFASAFRERLKSLTKKDRPLSVTVDISVCANRVVFNVVRGLLSLDVEMRVLYSEAYVYHPTEEEATEWREADTSLEKGVRDVFVSPEQPGDHKDPLPSSIIVIPSFRADRSKAAIARTDESLLLDSRGQVFWLLGQPRLEKDRWRLQHMKDTVGLIDEDVHQYVVSTFDYKDCLMTLQRVYGKEWGGRNVDLAPVGSKMQALGSVLFCYMHPDVRVLLTAPVEYNDLYSEGTRDIWCVDFESTRELRRVLDSVGSLVFEV